MLVSIIIPTYNRADKLNRCLKSLEQQTCKNFEVIICDDGSTDHTRDVVELYKGKLDLIYNYDTNFGGPAKPRNKGLQSAKGQFIAFLDSDDWWYPSKLEVSLRYLKDFDIVYHDLDKYVTDEIKKGIEHARPVKEDVFKDLLINGNALNNSSVVIRKSIVEKVGYFSEDINLIAVEDADYWIRVAKVTAKFKYIPQALGAYWLGNNISFSEKQVGRKTYLLNRYLDQLSQAERQQARKMFAFAAARTYHTLSLFSKAVVNYKAGLALDRITIKIRCLLGIIACKLKIVF